MLITLKATTISKPIYNNKTAITLTTTLIGQEIYSQL
jgi:hypothetical protein